MGRFGQSEKSEFLERLAIRPDEPAPHPLRLFDETLMRRYDDSMKTLSATQARANMTRLLDQAISGQSIGITHKGRIVKLQPVAVTEDWAAEEYGLRSDQLDQAADNLLRTGEDLLKSGKAVSWGGFKKGKRIR